MRRKKEKLEDEIQIEVLSNGLVKFRRESGQVGSDLFDILKKICKDEDIEELRKFFDSSKKIKQIIGKKSLCG
jgi:hypothetical protein